MRGALSLFCGAHDQQSVPAQLKLVLSHLPLDSPLRKRRRNCVGWRARCERVRFALHFLDSDGIGFDSRLGEVGFSHTLLRCPYSVCGGALKLTLNRTAVPFAAIQPTI